MGQSLLYWICLIIISTIVGALSLRFEEELKILSTSILGAFCAMWSILWLALERIDQRFMRVLQPASLTEETSRSPFVYGPILAAMLLAAFGIWYQYREMKAENEEPPQVYYGSEATRRKKTGQAYVSSATSSGNASKI